MGIDALRLLAQAGSEGAEVPPLATLLMVGAVVAGASMWLMGRRVAKAGGMVVGLFVGGVAGLLVGNGLAEEGAFTWALVVGGAAAGALMAVLLFRVWVALTAAVIMGLAVPGAVLVWQGTPEVRVEEVSEAEREVLNGARREAGRLAGERPREQAPWASGGEEVGERLEVPALAEGGGGGGGGLFDFPPPPRDSAGDEPGEQAPRASDTEDLDEEATAAERAGRVVLGVSESIRGLWDEQAASVRAWWEGLDEGLRSLLRMAALAGAAVGLVGGLLLPLHMASLETALVGAVLMLVPGRALAMESAGVGAALAGYLPQSPRGLVVAVGLLTLLGYLLQWSLWRRRAAVKRE